LVKVRVLFFGMLKETAGRAADSAELADGATLADLLRHYERTTPKIKAMLPLIAVSINQEYARPTDRLRDGDEVALLPPVSGGASRTEHCAIVRERIETQRILDGIKRGEDGATAVFEGIVRNNTRGRRTLYLEYEAYEEMALKKMEELARQALGDFEIREVTLVHRLGRLEISETSVLIVVASAHRGAAFEACRWLIDTLKKTVPIWKKEFFEDGAVWVDGDPFPENIARAQATPGTGEAS
jgi:MoaE-MoaD fusion protein